MIKALYINSVDISKSNGPGINETEFIKHASKDKDIDFFFLIPKAKNKLEWIKDVKNIEYLPMNTLRNPFKFAWFQYNIYITAKKIVKRENIDFVLLRPSRIGIGIHLYLKSISRLTPIFLKHFTFNTQKFFKKGIYQLFIKMINLMDNHLKKKQLDYSISIDVVTEEIKNGISSKYHISKNKIIVNPNAVNIHKFFPNNNSKNSLRKTLGIDSNKKIVGYIGGFPSIRGGEYLIKNAQNIIDAYKNVHFLVVGMDETFRKSINNMKNKEIYKSFTFTGVIPYTEIHHYFNLLDIGIALDDVERVKITGNSNQKVRQYLATGSPVITNSLGTNFIIKEKIGVTIDNLNNRTFTSAVVSLLNLEDDKKKKMIERSIKYAQENLSYEQSFNRMKAHWFSIIKN